MRKALLRTCAAVSAAGVVFGAAACSDDADQGVAGMTLTDSDTPAGWEWSDATEVFEDGDEEDINELLSTARSVETTPEQCAPLEPSPLASLAMLHDHPDTTAGVGFLPQDEMSPGVINAVISTQPDNTGMALPDDLSECSTFTQSSAYTAEDVTYQAEASEADVQGAEDVYIVTLISDAEVQSGDDTVTVVVGTVDGVGFRLDASGLEEPQMLFDLVDRQVDRIRGEDPDA